MSSAHISPIWILEDCGRGLEEVTVNSFPGHLHQHNPVSTEGNLFMTETAMRFQNSLIIYLVWPAFPWDLGQGFG